MIKTIFIILIFAGSVSGQILKKASPDHFYHMPAAKVKDEDGKTYSFFPWIAFDSTYIITVPGESGSKFDIGRVCQEVGCTGNFSTTGKHQTAWQILDNKIVLVYVTPKNGIFHTDLLIYQYSERWKKFVLLE